MGDKSSAAVVTRSLEYLLTKTQTETALLQPSTARQLPTQDQRIIQDDFWLEPNWASGRGAGPKFLDMHPDFKTFVEAKVKEGADKSGQKKSAYDIVEAMKKQFHPDGLEMLIPSGVEVKMNIGKVLSKLKH